MIAYFGGPMLVQVAPLLSTAFLVAWLFVGLWATAYICARFEFQMSINAYTNGSLWRGFAYFCGIACALTLLSAQFIRTVETLGVLWTPK